MTAISSWDVDRDTFELVYLSALRFHEQYEMVVLEWNDANGMGQCKIFSIVTALETCKNRTHVIIFPL